jgi:hypothetical protein
MHGGGQKFHLYGNEPLTSLGYTNFMPGSPFSLLRTCCVACIVENARSNVIVACNGGSRNINTKSGGVNTPHGPMIHARVCLHAGAELHTAWGPPSK